MSQTRGATYARCAIQGYRQPADRQPGRSGRSGHLQRIIFEHLDRDLLRLAAGVPDDAGFGRSLAGKDALTIHKQLEPGALAACCTRAIELFASDAYKRDFGFIDHITPVRDRTLIETLDALVFEELRKDVEEGGVGPPSHAARCARSGATIPDQLFRRRSEARR